MRYIALSIALSMIRFATLTLLLTSLLTFSSCNKGGTPVFSFDLEIPLEFSGGQQPLQTRTYLIYNIINFLEAELQQQGMTLDQVVKILPGKAILSADSPNVDYSWYHSVVVNAVSVQDPELIKEMFYQEYIELDHTGDLELLSSISELKPIMAPGIFNMQVKVRMKNNISLQTRHKLRITLDVFDE